MLSLSYYTSVIIMSLMALGVLCILVHENGRMQKDDKKLLYITYILVALSAIAEWTGVQLNGRDDIPEVLLLTAKTCDYILTPLAGGALVAQMHMKNIWQTMIEAVLAVNVALQIVSFFTGWMITIDEDHCYEHGLLFPLYLAICIMTVILLIIQFLVYGSSYKRQNRFSLYSIMIIIISGIMIQEVLPGGNRMSYLGMTLGAALMFIHYTEFTALGMDDEIRRKQEQIDTDVLTGLYSRRAFTEAIKAYNDKGAVPEDLAIFVIDINGLKTVNDNLGHDVGDELICGSADCVTSAYGGVGKCYRTGGDEFVVIAENMDRESIDSCMQHIKNETDKWSGKEVKSLGLSIGYAFAKDHPDVDADGLIREADYKMYAAKAEYYRKAGIERRRT